MLGIYFALMDTDEDRKSFEKLYHLHKNGMYHVAYSILKDEANAEDAVHDAFLSLAKNMNRITNMNFIEVRNYLIIIVRNAAFRIYNKGKREFCSEEIYENTPDLCRIEVDIENRDSQEKLLRLIKSLDEKYGDILVLKYFYDMKDKEIAKVLDITVQNVKIRLHRGKVRLKEMIFEEGLYDGRNLNCFLKNQSRFVVRTI